MLRAHSLLYAIYICLLVSIICGAMIYFFNLYGLLNQHYNLKEDLYIQNQSAINFALGKKLLVEENSEEEDPQITNIYDINRYGLLSLLVCKSSFKSDTVSSAHFVGSYLKKKTALHIANFTQNISFSGNVNIIGDCFLPNLQINPSYLTNEVNVLKQIGKKEISGVNLPKLSTNFDQILINANITKSNLEENTKVNDSIYFNSFQNSTKEIITKNTIENIIIKGNFVLKNKDSIRIRKNAVLEDVIIISPKIYIEEGFNGSAQFFSSEQIIVESKVILNYPSVICLKNSNSLDEAKIEIGENTKIFGAVVLFGNTIDNISKNTITFSKNTLLVGNMYCTGKIDLKGIVYGSVYTNKIFYKSPSSIHENLISNITIDPSKKPTYFIDIPLFEDNEYQYGILKKVK